MKFFRNLVFALFACLVATPAARCMWYDNPVVNSPGEVVCFEPRTTANTLLHIMSKGHACGASFVLAHAPHLVHEYRYSMRGTPLHEAAELSNHEMVEVLLARGAEVNGRVNPTPLHRAICGPHYVHHYGRRREMTVRLLLNAGADMERACGERRMTALQTASVLPERDDMIHLLLELGASLTSRRCIGCYGVVTS